MGSFVLLLGIVAGFALWGVVDLRRKLTALEERVEALTDELASRAPAAFGSSIQSVGVAEPPAPLSSVSLRSAEPAVPYETHAPPTVTAAELAVLFAADADPAPAWPLDPLPTAEVPADEPVTEPPRLPRFDFEQVFGRLLPIWGGGIALALAGFFLVRWSIERGIITQSVRVALAFGFGALLLAGAELAYRQASRVRDPRVAQALAGAGLATLYAGFYLAGSLYGLIGSGVAFAGLAAVTAAAIALSFRFGLPSAVLGLAGGFAAPALAGTSEPNLPVLATYLALVTAGLTYTGRRQGTEWLSLAALAGALAWGVVMLLDAGGGLSTGAVAAVGLYLALIGGLLPGLLGSGPLGQWGRLLAALLASIQLAALVHIAGYAPLAWGCYALLAGTLAVLGERWPRLREASAFAAAVVLWLLLAWPQPGRAELGIAVGAFALIFAGVPLARVWRGTAQTIDVAVLSAFPVAAIAVGAHRLGVPLLGAPAPGPALAAALLALLPLAGAALALRSAKADGALPVPERTGIYCGAAGAVLLTLLLASPRWAAPLAGAAVALAMWAATRRRDESAATGASYLLAASATVLLIATSGEREGSRLLGLAEAPRPLGALRWLAAALAWLPLLLAGHARPGTGRGLPQVLGVLCLYGATAMVVPPLVLPAVLAIGAAAVLWRAPDWRAAPVALLALGALWAAPPLAQWLGAGVEALTGLPLFVAALPGPLDAAARLLPLAAVLAAIAWHEPAIGILWRRQLAGLAAIPALIAAHVLFKQVFALDDEARFVALGLAERTAWQGLLAALSAVLLLGAARLPVGMRARVPDRLAAIPALVALAHFAWFSLLLHNPLAVRQAVGAVPLANLVTASFGIALGALWLVQRRTGLLAGARQPAGDAAAMALIVLLGLTTLRQLFAGSILPGPVSQTEDLLRSMGAVAIALGFLAWGARTRQRSWRVGSLVLMLLAVGKVFVFDAAGLEGLARIASFLGLGVCLIGIGWFYSRQLARPAPPQPEPQPAG